MIEKHRIQSPPCMAFGRKAGTMLISSVRMSEEEEIEFDCKWTHPLRLTFVGKSDKGWTSWSR